VINGKIIIKYEHRTLGQEEVRSYDSFAGSFTDYETSCRIAG
jgi:hypothetical protein